MGSYQYGAKNSEARFLGLRCHSGFGLRISAFSESDNEYFALPATTGFKSKKHFWVSSSSHFLPQIIAIIQFVLSSRQLYLNYNTSIKVKGLASPYLAVILYLVMTLVNFVANALVGSYGQVIVLLGNTTKGTSTNGGQASGIRR